MAEREDAAARSSALGQLGLEAPLRRLARPHVDEWAVRRLWEGVQRKRVRPARGERRSTALAALAALAAVLALVVAGAERAGWRAPGAAEAPAPAAAAPLLTREARPFVALEAPPAASSTARPGASTAPAPAAPARVDFADGSSIEAAPGTRVEALASTPGEFAVAVRRGGARFHVTPGGPRRWRIEASHAEVEVLGTVLWVESTPRGTQVRVDVGRVLVRSPELPGGSQPLGAGEVLQLGERPAAAPPVSLERRASGGSGASGRSTPLPRPRVVAPAAATLWAAADEARRAGQHERAATLLEQLVERFPEDSQVALAAFTLGVLQLDRLDRPVEAARSFQLALELGLGAALRDDAYLRWAEALGRAREHERLGRVSAEYARLHPRGRHRAAIERLAQAAPATRPRAESGPAPSRAPSRTPPPTPLRTP